MDDVVNRFARELADAIAAAVAENPQVEACREKARAAGFEMKVTLEAVVGFVSRSQTAALTKVSAPARVVPTATHLRGHGQRPPLPSVAENRGGRNGGAGRISQKSEVRSRSRTQKTTRAGSLRANRPSFFALFILPFSPGGARRSRRTTPPRPASSTARRRAPGRRRPRSGDDRSRDIFARWPVPVRSSPPSPAPDTDPNNPRAAYTATT